MILEILSVWMLGAILLGAFVGFLIKRGKCEGCKECAR
jgi:hypothetical protein